MKKVSLKQATAFFALSKYITVFVGIIISAVLARLLTPDDYGVVAVVTVFTTFFATLANMGFGTGVIQNKTLTSDDVNIIYSFTVWVSLVLSVTFCILSYPIALFYGRMVYVPVCCLLSISVFFNAMNMIPNAVMLKEQRFVEVGALTIVSAVGSGILGIVLALCGWKYYALVMQSVFSAMIPFVWNLISTRLKFLLRINMMPIRKILNYSMNQFGYNFINMIAQNLDNLLTGKLMGSEQLAYYNKSYTLMRYPVNNIPHVISPVLHPILSNYQNNPEYIYEKYVEITKIISLIGVYCFAIFNGLSEEIVLVMFGKQWGAAVIPVKIFSWCLWAQLVNALAGSIYQSLGKTKEMFRSGIVHVVVTILAIILGALTGSIEGLSIYVMVSLNIKFLVESIYLIKKSFGYSLLNYWKKFVPEMIMMIVFSIVNELMNSKIYMGLFPNIMVKICIITFLFVTGLAMLGQTKYFTRFIRNRHKE